ncbi:MAG: FAD-dependent oxidoreductase [Planctomycetota bacterium]
MGQSESTDCLVVGGGVIGLSIAYELARGGRTVRLLERGQTGREASWAGAGVLPPGSWYLDHPAADWLAAESCRAHAELSEELAEAAGIDDQYARCGAIYLQSEETRGSLAEKFAGWRTRGIEVETLGPKVAASVAPGVACGAGYFVPGEAQVRNPRRLRALHVACERRGVRIETGVSAEAFTVRNGRIESLQTSDGPRVAGGYCLAAGAWVGPLAESLGVRAPVRPIRGQMLLLRLPRPVVDRIVHRDGLYLVPRSDGKVLVGATVEDAGFDKSTNPTDLQALRRFAVDVVPALADAEVEKSWAGLRPGSADGLPLIGPLAGLANAWIAGGHFRSGLQFAPATARLVRGLMGGEAVDAPIEAFAPNRFTDAAA